MATTTAGLRARRLTAEEQRTFRVMRTRATSAKGAPYMVYVLFRLKPVAVDGLGTFAVDDSGRVYIDFGQVRTPENPQGEWSLEEATGVLLHESHHVLRRHGARSGSMGAIPRAWNVCADAEINQGLLREGVRLPEQRVTPAGLELEEGHSAEWYYNRVRARKNDPGKSGPDPEPAGSGAEDACGGGSGVTGQPGPWELDREDGLAPAVSQVQLDAARQQVAEEIQRRVKQAGSGSIPEHLREWAEEELKPPVVDWRTQLRNRIRQGVATVAGRTDYSWKRISRRSPRELPRPALRAPAPRFLMAVDVSFSMSPEELAAALSEVAGIARQVGVRDDRLELTTVDSEAHPRVRLRNAAAIRLRGGGGTDMRKAFEEAARRPRPDILVLFTDGYTPWPEERPRDLVTIVCLTEPGQLAAVPEWATAIDLTAGRETG